MSPESHERKSLALALLYAVAHRFLCGAIEVPFYAVVDAAEEAKRLGASAHEIRGFLEKADAATKGQQSIEAAARMKELLSA